MVTETIPVRLASLIVSDGFDCHYGYVFCVRPGGSLMTAMFHSFCRTLCCVVVGSY